MRAELLALVCWVQVDPLGDDLDGFLAIIPGEVDSLDRALRSSMTPWRALLIFLAGRERALVRLPGLNAS